MIRPQRWTARRQSFPASIRVAGWLCPRFGQRDRGFIADRAVWPFLVVVSPPSLQLFGRICKRQGPVRVQVFRSEPANASMTQNSSPASRPSQRGNNRSVTPRSTCWRQRRGLRGGGRKTGCRSTRLCRASRGLDRAEGGSRSGWPKLGSSRQSAASESHMTMLSLRPKSVSTKPS